MDIDLSPAQEDLAHRAREWLAVHKPVDISGDLDQRVRQLQDWQRALYDAGFLGLGWPEEFGGAGGTLLDRIVFNQELARSRAPMPVGLVSLEVVGPTILEFGTPEQKHRLLPPLLRGDELWCQGFSEPDAGSDLAALRTRATEVEAGWHVTGQKVWTSWAQFSSWCAVLARTDADATGHRGISYLLVEMERPGITIRPLEQMTGDPEFSEVFFDDVLVDVDMVLGSPGDGWRLAMATLGYERGPFSLRQQFELRVALDEVVEQLIDSDRSPLDDPHALRELGRAEMFMEALSALGFETVTRLLSQPDPAANSIDKLFLGQVEQVVYAYALDQLGPHRTTLAPVGSLDTRRWVQEYLYSRAATIYGGTSQIQRGIVATRVLNLPRA
jgi:alkylation response protein AidB-like acyl-CoA dehydrogenase